MMISVKKGFISSNSRIICLPCPLSCGHFFIQESAVGGLSYYTKKDCRLRDSPSVSHYVIIYASARFFMNSRYPSVSTTPTGSEIHADCTNPATM